ncbi:MAG: glycosyltransferase family 4 protein [Candidatus Melainabacteria bacterium]|nr:glycosyltransferase family 4 protein [Candidatus Melainabacteria bacterium]
MPLNQNSSKYKIAALLSHPIQYQAPFFKTISKCHQINLKVFFCSGWGLEEYKDEGFGQSFKWNIPLLEGYKSEFLKNISPCPNVSNFFGLVNPDIIKKIKEEKYDALWIHGWNSFTNWIAVYTASSLGIPVLLRSETNLLPKLPQFKKTIKKIILKNFFNKVSSFLAIGKYNTEFYESYEIPREKIFLVPYSVDNEFFVSKAKELQFKKIELRKKYNLPLGVPVILFSGKLIDRKNPMGLLKAYEGISTKNNSALVFIGDGCLKSKLKDFTRKYNIKNVYFLGFKNQTELPEFYALADIFVLPSEHEPWGLVVNEAMCFKLPVVVSNQVGAIGDLVKDGINGFIYPCRNTPELLKKLNLLVSNSDLREKFGQESYNIIKNWSYEEGVKGILSCMGFINERF